MTSPVNEIASATPPGFESYLAFGIYSMVALGLIAVLLLLSWGLGHRTRSRTKNEPYESGVYPTDNARLKGPVPFYLVAIFFIVFDVEAVFVVSWAVAYDLLGWAGFLQIAFFIIILFLGLVYLWKMGGLEWGSRGLRERLQDGGRK